MGCCQNYEKNSLNILGLGMIVYFKIIKALAIIFLIMSIINGFLYYVYITNHKLIPVNNYRDALFKTTIGNIGSGKIKF